MKHLRLIGIVAFAVFAIPLVMYIFHSKEPRFQDRTLTQWLVERQKYKNPFVQPVTLSVEAQQAVKAIGSNAIPILLAMVQVRDSTFKTKLNSALNRQRIIGFRFRTAAEQRAMAFAGFQILQEAAKGAAPTLASLMADPDAGVRYTTLKSIRCVTSNDNELVPLFLAACRDPEPRIRFIANTDLHFRSPQSLVAAGIPDILEETSKQGTNESAPASVPPLLSN